MSLTAQVTPVLVELATVAINWRVIPRLRAAVAGATDTVTGGGAVMVTVSGSLFTAPGAGCVARRSALPTIVPGMVVLILMLVALT